MNLDDIKSRCRTIIMDHLKSKGFPGMSRQQIIDELLPIWRKMDEAGIIQEAKISGKFKEFEALAVQYARQAAFLDKFKKVGNVLKTKKQ